ncbi:hypothetical protein F220043C3_05390 [Enterocloster asparagiformis]|uniref:hypothetical protein n=1 Tax=Enterocloster asparagiformis TaxID=333367 RepID=UPI0034BB276B
MKIRRFYATDYELGGVRAIFLTEKAGQEASDVHPMGKMVIQIVIELKDKYCCLIEGPLIQYIIGLPDAGLAVFRQLRWSANRE